VCVARQAHRRATKRRLPYETTQCYLPLDTRHPLHIRQAQTFVSFKRYLNTYYFSVRLSCPLAFLSNAPWFSCEFSALYKLVLAYLLTVERAKS